MFGPVERSVRTADLQKAEYLSELKINILVCKHNYIGFDTYQDEINYLIGQPCLFGRKFNSKCKIIQNKSNLQNVEKIRNLTHYLTKKICN